MANTTIVAPTTPNEQTTVVLAVLNRFVHYLPLPDCTGMLAMDRRIRQPDINMQAYDRIVLTWYNVAEHGNARVQVRCSTGDVLIEHVHLQHGAIETIRTQFASAQPPKPNH
jgi:hypothetical protein